MFFPMFNHYSKAKAKTVIIVAAVRGHSLMVIESKIRLVHSPTSIQRFLHCCCMEQDVLIGDQLLMKGVPTKPMAWTERPLQALPS